MSQPVPPMGAIKGEGITNQLGRPSLDRLTVLVREAAQNSWDAADPDRDGAVDFALDLRTLDAGTRSAWKDLLSIGAPASSDLPLRAHLESDALCVLFVADRGTDGLGGPTRADEVRHGEAHDYVSFVLNVGEPRDTELGGGTYGYGKAVFFSVSAARSILVHTHCVVNGEVEARLIGCAVGSSFEEGERSYTGRHWFGLVDDANGTVEPVRGHEADRLAARLGFPTLGEGELGTTIGVIAPEFDGRDMTEAAEELASAIAWHLWPKMVSPSETRPAMQFQVSVDGVVVDVPKPASHPVLGEFVDAFHELDDGELVTFGAGATPVGRLRLRTTFAPPPSVEGVGIAAGVGPRVHHCCLLRAPELVVEYRSGPPLSMDHVWYAGVFRVFDDLDETFARAEPPTHDAWSPDYLEDRERSIVKVTLRKIDEAMREHAAPRQGAVPASGAEGLAGLSRMLGNFVAAAAGQAAGPRTRIAGSTSRARTRIALAGDPAWDTHDGRSVLVQTFEINPAKPTTIEAETSVRVWGGGGAESEAPLGAASPKMIAWLDPTGGVHPPGPIAVQPSERGLWAVLVEAPPDSVTQVRVREAKGE